MNDPCDACGEPTIHYTAATTRYYAINGESFDEETETDLHECRNPTCALAYRALSTSPHEIQTKPETSRHTAPAHTS